MVITNLVLWACEYLSECGVPEKFRTFENTSSLVLDNLCLDQSFQGFVLFDDWGDDCPLESVSRVDPFHFTDETQIIYLQSSYFSNGTRNHSCLWQFTAPDGYGMKYSIEVLNIVSPVLLNIENSTERLKT